jgi:cytochrome c oxidase subunit 2
MAITRFTKWGATGLAAAPFLMWGAGARAELGLNMPQGVTAVSREVYDLHMLIFWICVVIAIGVFGVMFWSIFHHRKSRGAVPAQFHESTLVEIVWTVVPMLILIGMAVPATKTLVKMYDSREAELTIKVTGYQWRWQYDYLDQNVGFLSVLSTPTAQIRNTAPKGEHYLLEVDNPMVVPVGKKVRILTTAADVIHSWWVPEWAGKKTPSPVSSMKSWTKSKSRASIAASALNCAVRITAFMPIVVKAVPEAEFQEWLGEDEGQEQPNRKKRE